ncbi:CDP-glucose 4,6-dehydratase [Pelagicoccus sp. SDUM812005]|uniref:CDP-glucose 4,6-dehydratase n=1 Tax=Pelagicoccus sp. SDUM812005 TaxID=3041257 RepID=UPI00280FB002|nr:CDP-glucose 4,6-dehydratase [Pelagicoccus sp. SDUM812005]MDQ8180935.1 CDP-glucose 4,6-dehydratase [Pelagicoccus sp. SDUM812005]
MSLSLQIDELSEFYRTKTVLVTGHSGFKGAWLSQWLVGMGANVIGLSNNTPTTPSLSQILRLSESIRETWIDINDLPKVLSIVEKTKPDLVFHLAAQPIVLHSYNSPVETFKTNIAGTTNILEALRQAGKRSAGVFITSDKCYENSNDGLPFTENHKLGGNDPYSASKACAEIAISAYRASFFPPDNPQTKVGIASARAGNVIGGGDWSDHRILPDCARCLSNGIPIPVRNPSSVRPWQHVLEPLYGYLLLGYQIYNSLCSAKDASLSKYTTAFNFGPPTDQQRDIQSLVEEVLKHWPGNWRDHSSRSAKPEADTLTLNSDKATTTLRWQPSLSFQETVRYTVEWYRNFYETKNDPAEFTRKQIRDYQEAIRAAQI